MKNEKRKLYKIKMDNAALIYPCAATKDWKSVHRITVELKDNVKPDILQKSLDNIVPRFPSFNVYLKKGFFWHYFIEATKTPKVEEEKVICRKFELRNGFLYRILYTQKTVAIETFHSVSDGMGAVMFLNTMLAEYFKLLGKKITNNGTFLNVEDSPREEEIEDAFHKNADLLANNKRSETKAYQIKGTNLFNQIKVQKVNLNLMEFKQLIKEKGYKITEFLIANYLEAMLWEKQTSDFSKSIKPIKLSIAINLRQFFETETLRNFSSYINLELDSTKRYEFDEIIEIIRTQCKKINKQYLMNNINPNVRAEKNIFVKFMPLFIKKHILNFCYNHFGEVYYSSVFSNLGQIKTPDEFYDLVDHYECMVGASKLNTKCLCCATFNNNVCLTFTSKIKEDRIEERFKSNLINFGIKIK